MYYLASHKQTNALSPLLQPCCGMTEFHCERQHVPHLRTLARTPLSAASTATYPSVDMATRPAIGSVSTICDPSVSTCTIVPHQFGSTSSVRPPVNKYCSTNDLRVRKVCICGSKALCMDCGTVKLIHNVSKISSQSPNPDELY